MHSLSSETVTPVDRRWQMFCLLVMIVGIVLRFSNLDRKVFWGDEVYTAMRVSGYTQGDLAALYDGKLHSIAEVQRLQHLDPHHGIPATIYSLVVDDPQHPPLFYVAERLWASVAGDDPAQLRMLAAIISLFAFPALFLVCRELFANDRVGYIAIALLAVSPFHLIYAHEAREYSLWTATTLLATWLLLRAVRRNTLTDWAWYAASVALTLYGDLLSVYVLAAHGFWSLSLVRNQRPAFLRFLAAFFVGIGAFAVWIIRIWHHWTTFTSYMSWGNFRYPLKSMVQKWVFNTGTVLFDLEYAQIKLAIVAGLGLLVMLVAVIYTARKAPRPAALLLGLLGGVVTLAIVGQDFRSGTYFSTIARYLTPLWLALEIALAFSFQAWFGAKSRLARDGAVVAFGLVIALSTVSSVVNGRAEAWWNNHTSASAPQLARVINAQSEPLLISSYKPDTLLVLSHTLRPDVQVLLVNDQLPKSLPPGFFNYDLLSPSAADEAQATKNGHFVITRRADFIDESSPVEQFHHRLRRDQSAAHVKLRQTPQDFLIELAPRGAYDPSLPFRKALPSRLAFSLELLAQR